MAYIKKHLHLEEAERLFVYEQWPISAIAEQCKLAVKTVHNWCVEYNWVGKRKEYIANKTRFHEELYEFARSLMDSIKRDLQEKKEIPQSRYYAFIRILPLITSVKRYEDEIISEKSEAAIEANGKQTGLSKETIDIIEKAILGM